jgi:hypothetical protein
MSVSKYRAIKTEVDGIVFASKKEATRYGELRLLQRAGKIEGLTCQPKYELIVNGKKVGRYTADFSYFDRDIRKMVAEEVKGYRVRDYALRRNVFRALNPDIEHREI